MKHVSEVIEERYGPKAARWLCEECGKNHQALGEIWGLPARRCEICSKFGLIRKYKWIENKPLL